MMVLMKKELHHYSDSKEAADKDYGVDIPVTENN